MAGGGQFPQLQHPEEPVTSNQAPPSKSIKTLVFDDLQPICIDFSMDLLLLMLEMVKTCIALQAKEIRILDWLWEPHIQISLNAEAGPSHKWKRDSKSGDEDLASGIFSEDSRRVEGHRTVQPSNRETEDEEWEYVVWRCICGLMVTKVTEETPWNFVILSNTGGISRRGL